MITIDDPLRTLLCDQLGISVPIMQAGMSIPAGPALAAAVSNAGGLGVLGTGLLRHDPERLTQEIATLRSMTDRPFGVDVVVASAYVSEDGLLERARTLIEAMPPDERKHVVSVLDDLRPGGTQRLIEICAEQRVPVVVTALGSPRDYVPLLHAAGTLVFSLVGSVRQAVSVVADGVDAVIATGSEAGGHVGAVGSLSLWNACVQSLPVPVVAAGGVADGRSLAAAMVMGCVGAWVGTRFVATHEARVHGSVKEALAAASPDDCRITRAFTGKNMRALTNEWSREWAGREDEILPFPLQLILAGGGVRAMERGDTVHGSMPAGQGVGVMHEVLSAGDVVAAMARDCRDALTAPHGTRRPAALSAAERGAR